MTDPTLTLIRHAPTRLNIERRYLGHLDPELGPAGEAAARAVGRRMARFRDGDGPVLLFTSDLARARRTAELVIPGRRLRTDPRLRELDFGDFDGLTYEENLRRHGARFRRWIDDPIGHPPPGGESLDSLRRRVLAWLSDLPRSAPVVAVTHGGPLRVLTAALLALPHQERRCRAPAPASILRTPLPRSVP